jgi:hypothetical protein
MPISEVPHLIGRGHAAHPMRSFRLLIHALGALALLGLLVPMAATANAPDRLFAPGSVWNAPLSDHARLDPSSPARTAALLAEVRAEIQAGTGPWISETQYSTPIYTVGRRQRRVRVTLDAGTWAASLKDALVGGVPIPPHARPAVGTDRHLTIYQPATDTLWEFWKAIKLRDGWHASWGGAMRNVSESPGYYTSSSWPGLKGDQGWNWGSTATSLPVAGGTIRIDELRRGRIDHALAVDLPNACAKVFAWPAQRTDGTLTTSTCIPEGARLRVDPALDLSTLNLPPITLILARAAQRYGMIVRDKTLHAVGFFAEDPARTGTNPFVGPTGLYGGLRPWNFVPCFPWSRLQLMKMKTCTAAPCVRRTPALRSSDRATR